jgi:hypothetical protein
MLVPCDGWHDPKKGTPEKRKYKNNVGEWREFK